MIVLNEEINRSYVKDDISEIIESGLNIKDILMIKAVKFRNVYTPSQVIEKISNIGEGWGIFSKFIDRLNLEKVVVKLDMIRPAGTHAYEIKRWEIAEKFSMVVGLANDTGNKFEDYVIKTLRSKKYLVIKNVRIDDKNLTKMTLNFQHPEADIIAKKNGSYILISCKEADKKPKNSQFYVGLKAELDRLSEYKEDIGFTKVILAVKANLSDKTWRTLEDYASNNSIEIWGFR